MAKQESNPILDEQGSKEAASSETDLPITQRQNEILTAIILDYIRTVEPVGSKSLVENFDLNISPATVRNEMAVLEEKGYLTHPHASAGRVPTDKGYRFYVDMNLQPAALAAEQKAMIREVVRQSVTEVSHLIETAAELLEMETGLTAFCISPDYTGSTIQQIRLLLLEPGKALLLVVLKPQLVNDKIVRIPSSLDEEDVAILSKSLDQALAGLPIHDLTMITVTLSDEIARHADLLTDLSPAFFEAITGEVTQAINEMKETDLFLKASYRLLDQPEFADVQVAKEYLACIHDKDCLKKLMVRDPMFTDHQPDHSDQMRRFMIKIGSEIGIAGLEGCSFILSSFDTEPGIQGQLGVIGPKRMKYSKVVSNIDFINLTLTEAFRSLMPGADGEDET